MHIVLAFLGVVATLLVVLHRLAELGIDPGGLNPFLWKRRRAWRRKFEANPIFSIDDPKTFAAVLVAGVAKIDGDMSAQEKAAILTEFEDTFSIDAREASELLGSSVYLLGDAAVLSTQLDDVVGRGRGLLTAGQIDSLLSLMEHIAHMDGGPTSRQLALLESVRARLAPEPSPRGTWG